MKLFFHFAYTNFSNTYILGPEKPGKAILIDPGVMDIHLLDMIERNGYYISHILVTHGHEGHIQGIPTLKKIYDAVIYGGTERIFNYPVTKLVHGDRLTLSGMDIGIIGLPGHTSTSLAYKIDDMVFTGDALSAGTVGSTIHSFAHEINVQSIQDHILSMEDHVLIFPGHGPPTTVESEKMFNTNFRSGTNNL